ncbi:MAG: SGNH/GDSL hydrolase family protein [Verrucomicrobia bacterium]|nr:SGNH/GDSL hydrolase family protein [Verrucomicrobiota bacterium]
MKPVPHVPYLFKPGTSFDEYWTSNPRGYFDEPDNRLTYRINNAGFRGGDIDIDKKAQTRVAFVGDSFCWGLGVREEDLFHRKAGELSTAAGRDVELLNFGIPGFDTGDEVALFRQVVSRFRPDICVIWFVLNDVGVGSRLGTVGRLGGDDMAVSLRKRLYLADLLIAPIDSRVNSRRLIKEYQEAYTKGSSQVVRLAAQLKRFASLCHAMDVEPVLVIHPLLLHLDGEYPFSQMHDTVATLAREAGIRCLDLLPSFAGKHAQDLWVHPSDQHPNEKAHQIAGTAVYRYLDEILEEENDSGPEL